MTTATHMPILGIALLFLGLVGAPAFAQTTGGDGSSQAAADALAAQREAEARKAIAEAERAELLASLPPSTSRPLQGSVDSSQFGAAGLVKAFDLAQQLARDVCAALPDGRRAAIYEPASTQGLVAARTVSDGISRLTDDLGRQNRELQAYIDTHTPPGSKAISPAVVALTVIPATVKAAADVAALFKSDVTAAGRAWRMATARVRCSRAR